jgi:hypothetical protein
MFICVALAHSEPGCQARSAAHAITLHENNADSAMNRVRFDRIRAISSAVAKWTTSQLPASQFARKTDKLD